MSYSSSKRSEEVRKKILDIIIEYISKHGYPPTVREISKLSGLKSTSSVHLHLIKMLEGGMIETDAEAGSNRAIRVPHYKFVKESEQNELFKKS